MGKVHWGGCNQLRLAQPPPGCVLVCGYSPCCFHFSRLRPQQAPHAPTSSHGSARRIRCTFDLRARKCGVTLQVLSLVACSGHCCAIDNAQQPCFSLCVPHAFGHAVLSFSALMPLRQLWRPAIVLPPLAWGYSTQEIQHCATPRLDSMQTATGFLNKAKEGKKLCYTILVIAATARSQYPRKQSYCYMKSGLARNSS